MQPKRLGELIGQAVSELKHEKLCLIEDIFKVKKHLHAMEVPGHDVITGDNPGEVFDELYELKICDLEVLLAQLSARLTLRARQLAGIDK